MDVWIEFKNASKFQAEHLFRNFFPSSDAEMASQIELETELEPLEMPAPSPSSPTTSQLSSLFSEALSGLSSASSRSGSLSPLSSPTPGGSHSLSRRSESVSSRVGKTETETETCEVSSGVEEPVAACAHAAPPLSAANLAQLAKQFADSIPDEGFSVAALQGCEFPVPFRIWLDIPPLLLRYASGCGVRVGLSPLLTIFCRHK
jgi:chaperone BCS1